MAEPAPAPMSRAVARAMVLPLALAQFIASYAATNMNVAISTIADDLDTTVIGVQTAITFFTLTMASLMIPGSKLTDIWGRKRCFLLGLIIYGAGALLAALAPGIVVLGVGYSLLEGVGSALMIPPIYILITVWFDDNKTRARYFGVVSGAGGLGAAAGPLIGGLITSAIDWRVSFLLQVAVVASIIVLGRRITDPPRVGRAPHFDLIGAVLSAVGMFFVVLGILQSGTYGWFESREDFTILGTVVIPEGGISPVWLLAAIGAAFIWLFVRHVRAVEKAGADPLLSLSLFRSKPSNLGLVTQHVQWLVLQGTFFVTSVYLQQVWGYSAIETGLMLIPATFGILAASALAQRMAERRSTRLLIRGGFAATIVGMLLLLLLVREDSAIITWVPGLLLMGLGVGIMLTASVNLVQSAWPESVQGDISGLSRSVSNLGSSLGTALAGSVIAGSAAPGGRAFAWALTVLAVIAALGLLAAMFLPEQLQRQPGPDADGGTAGPKGTTGNGRDRARRSPRHPAKR